MTSEQHNKEKLGFHIIMKCSFCSKINDKGTCDSVFHGRILYQMKYSFWSEIRAGKFCSLFCHGRISHLVLNRKPIRKDSVSCHITEENSFAYATTDVLI